MNGVGDVFIRGNLTLDPDPNDGIISDGSARFNGTLYTNFIKEYTPGISIDIHNVIFHSTGSLYIPLTSPSIGFTSGALITDGGITIRNTSAATSPSSGGAFTSFGGASFVKDIQSGGEIDMNDNQIRNLRLIPIEDHHSASKWYVDQTRGVYGMFTSGQVLIASGTSGNIIGYPSLTFDGATLSVSSLAVTDDIYLTPLYTTFGNGVVDMTDIYGVFFNTNISKVLFGKIAVKIDLSTGQTVDELFDINILNKESGGTSGNWLLSYTCVIGGLTGFSGIRFGVTEGTTGALQYTSSLIPNWVSTNVYIKLLNIRI